jgi:ATP-binding cassette subfamily C protein CydCD
MRASPLVRRALGVSVALGLLTTVAIVVQAAALSSALGAVFYHHRVDVGSDVGWFLAATLVRALGVGLSESLTSRIAAPVRRDLRARLLSRVLRRGPVESVDATVQLATTGVDAIESYVANYVPSLVLATLAPIILLGFLAWRDPLSAVIVLAAVALLPIFMVLLGLEAKEKMEHRWSDQQRLAGYFGDVVRGMGVLKAHRRSQRDVEQLDRVGRELQRTTMATLKVAFLSSFALELLSSLATALVALILGIRLMNGSLALSVALAVLLITPEVFLPLRRSAAQYHGSSDGIAAASTVLDLVGRAAESPSLRRARTSPDIVLENVEITSEDRLGVESVSAVVPAGELTVIRGPSGSGKTTLLRVLVGLRDVDRGRVLVDGVDLAHLDLEQWQSSIAYLPQDPRLPGSSTREVLSMGEPDITDEDMRDVLASLELPLELDRDLGEGAAALSAGQRRRLALARCLLRRPQLLVLDEPTAHLDEHSEALVSGLIHSLTMTRVIATHRDFASDHVLTMARSLSRD